MAYPVISDNVERVWRSGQPRADVVVVGEERPDDNQIAATHDDQIAPDARERLVLQAREGEELYTRHGVHKRDTHDEWGSQLEDTPRAHPGHIQRCLAWHLTVRSRAARNCVKFYEGTER